MAARNIRIVPKFIRANVVDFGAVFSDGSTKWVARVEYPQDNQINDNVDTNRIVADALSKRLRKSIP